MYNQTKYTPLRRAYAWIGFSVLVVVSAFLLWKAATYDYCLLWYGEPCFPAGEEVISVNE